MDLSKMSLSDLHVLQDQVSLEIKVRQEEELISAREQIQKIAQNLGMTVSDILGKPAASKVGKTRGPVAVKYRHPVQSSSAKASSIDTTG